MNQDHVDDSAAFITYQTDFHEVDCFITATGLAARAGLLEPVSTNLKLQGFSGKALRQTVAACSGSFAFMSSTGNSWMQILMTSHLPK